jgi:hypothetical protein
MALSTKHFFAKENCWKDPKTLAFTVSETNNVIAYSVSFV